MELEITIKVPLGAGGVSVEQRATEDQASPSPVEAWQAPPPVHLLETSGNGGPNGKEEPETTTEPDGTSHHPPDPADYGLISTTAAENQGPPSVDVLDRAAGSDTQAAPPGLEDFDFGAMEPFGSSPGLDVGPPDVSEAPGVSAEHAPPPPEAVEAKEARNDLPSGKRRGTSRKKSDD